MEIKNLAELQIKLLFWWGIHELAFGQKNTMILTLWWMSFARGLLDSTISKVVWSCIENENND